MSRVLKEMMIVATLGGLIAFVAVLAILTRKRNQYPVEWRFAIVVAVGALTLVLAYSMLVFDERYLFPLIPLVLAIAARFLVLDREFDHDGWKKLSIVLVVLGIVGAMIYPSSPFRLLSRDFQASYDAARRLEAHSVSNVVSIGFWSVSRTRSRMGGGL
jgi:ABC-type Fe3+-siderophore transport system permease subunit